MSLAIRLVPVRLHGGEPSTEVEPHDLLCFAVLFACNCCMGTWLHKGRPNKELFLGLCHILVLFLVNGATGALRAIKGVDTRGFWH